MVEVIDGRTARREMNRARVVEAMLELIDERGIDPKIDEVVERSGISERSIFRYFDNLDDLRRAVIQRNFERVEPVLDIGRLGDGSLVERIDRIVACRLEMSETIAGAARLGRRNAPFEPLVAADVARFRSLLAEQVREQFAPELTKLPKARAEDLQAIIDVLLSVETWDRLMSDHGRSRQQIRRAWTSTLRTLLDGEEDDRLDRRGGSDADPLSAGDRG